MNLQLRNRGGDLWQIRVRVAGRDHYRHLHGSREQAETAGRAFAAELVEQGAPPASPATPFARWAEDWLTRHGPALAARTLQEYRSLLDQHLLPALGRRPLQRITAGDGLALQAALLRSGRHPATVRHVLRLGRAILTEAVLLRVIPADPWAAIRQRCPRPEPRAVLDPARFRDVAARAGGETGELIALALATGARRGELLALRWRQVSLAAGQLVIDGALEVIAGAVRRKAPKTAAGRRTIALPGSALDLLRARRTRAAETALATGTPLDLLPVFPGADGFSWANPDAVTMRVLRALRRLGIADSLHGMRHAHATALLSDGINPRSVAARLGHADIKTTMGVYGHCLPRDEAAAVAALDRVLTA